MKKGISSLAIAILVIGIVFVIVLSLSNNSSTGNQYSTISAGFGGAGKCVRASPTVILSPSSQSASAGNILSYSVTVRNNDSGNSCKSSTFNLAGLVPAGWSYTLGPTSLTVSPGFIGTTTFRVASLSSAPANNYAVLVTATNIYSGLSGSGSAVYAIPLPPFDFSLSLSPTSATMFGNNVSTTASNVIVSLLAGTTENVALSLSGCPQKALCLLSRTSGNPTYSSTLSITTAQNGTTPAGVYSIVMTGTSSTLTRTGTFSLTIV